MKDIDFDELDRAVASVLGGSNTSTPAPAPTPPAQTPVESSPPTPSTPKPEAATSEPVAAPTPSTPPEAKPVAAAAQTLHVPAKPVQRGRFLDMVHPARDMSSRKPTVAAAPAPTSIDATPPTVPTPTPPAANSAFLSDVVAPRSAPVPTPKQAEATPVTVPEASDPTPAQVEDFFASSEPSKPEEPVVSPFIPDAIVEKRPLGAFSATESQLPSGDELHEQLVKVESDDSASESAESPIPSSSAFTPAPKTVATPAKATSVTPPAVVSAPAPTPIKPPVTDSNFSLFDKDEPQPTPRTMKVAKHGKESIIWITVLVAVILIGFGVGATFYFRFLAH